MRRLLSLLIAASCLIAPPAIAEPAPGSTASVLPARDTARLRPAGSWSVGVFNPLRYSVSDGLELEAHPLLLVSAPHLGVRADHHRAGDWQLTGDYGLALPTPAFRMAPPLGVAGYLGPSCMVTDAEPDRAPDSCQQPGWTLVARAGLLASTGTRHVWTLRGEFAYGLPLDDAPRRPLEAWAPVELAFAPMLSGWRARLGGRYDRALLDGLRGSAELDVFALGNPTDVERSPWVAQAHLGLDLAVGQSSRVTAGVMYWNSDQHAAEWQERDGRWQLVHVRSHDFAPTLDFIWSN